MGDHHPNFRSIGIELPAHLNSHDLFQRLLDVLLPEVRSLQYWTTHHIIDPEHKTDPVTGTCFDEYWMNGRGLQLVGREPLGS